MMVDKRRFKRVPVHLPVLVDAGPGIPLRPCVMLEVSEEGARLQVQTPEKLPLSFTLLLSKCGFPRRNCVVTWHSRNEVGVNFRFAGRPA